LSKVLLRYIEELQLMVRAYKSIYAQQLVWAARHGVKYDNDGYTLSLNENLYLPLLPVTEEEFKRGKGDELGSSDKRGKMRALHSSSALAINVFQYWRTRNVDNIARACGAPQGMTEMRFEQIHPTPLGGVPPHLDVEFRGSGLKPVAIEAKFTEPYHRHIKRTINDSYFSHAGLWAQLPRCEKLARRIRKEEQGKTSFTHLDAPQLLKHILGLAREYGPTGFELLYLWYEAPSPEAERHRIEIEDFSESIADEIHFRDMTYQKLFESIKKCPDTDGGYIGYLAERYFPSPINSSQWPV
jgi:hypothetical protein